MPALSAAWIIIEFFGTCSFLPSISMFTKSCGAAGAVGCALMRAPVFSCHPGESRDPATLIFRAPQKSLDSGFRRNDEERKRRSRCNLQRRIHDTALVRDEVFELVPEVAQETLHGPRGGFTERADGVAFNLTRCLLEHFDVLHRRVAFDNASQHAIHPARSLAAWRALAARFGEVETRYAATHFDHARSVVHHDDGA